MLISLIFSLVLSGHAADAEYKDNKQTICFTTSEEGTDILDVETVNLVVTDTETESYTARTLKWHHNNEENNTPEPMVHYVDDTNFSWKFYYSEEINPETGMRELLKVTFYDTKTEFNAVYLMAIPKLKRVQGTPVACYQMQSPDGVEKMPTSK